MQYSNRGLIALAIAFACIELCSCACEIKWVKTDHKNIPAAAVLANTGNSLGDFYPSRAEYKGALTPGRYKPAEEKCFLTMDGKEESVWDNFEVLTNPNNCILQWKHAREGTIPKNSILAGKDKTGVSNK
jgi:hypothetical protein